jgi:hypothetical protein
LELLLLWADCAVKAGAIIQVMTRFFIMFLIALLPLRGWSVQNMVMQMGAPSVASQTAEPAMGEDCALHMQQSAEGEAGHTAHPKPDHKGCQNCQLCMPLAALQTFGGLALTTSAQTVPLMGSSHFVSADRARDAKPPIS